MNISDCFSIASQTTFGYVCFEVRFTVVVLVIISEPSASFAIKNFNAVD